MEGGQKGNGGEGMRGAGNEGNLGLTIIEIIIIRMTMKKLRFCHFTCQQLLAYFPLLIVVVEQAVDLVVDKRVQKDVDQAIVDHH